MTRSELSLTWQALLLEFAFLFPVRSPACLWLIEGARRAANRGRLFLGYFILAKQNKVTSNRSTTGEFAWFVFDITLALRACANVFAHLRDNPAPQTNLSIINHHRLPRRDSPLRFVEGEAGMVAG